LTTSSEIKAKQQRPLEAGARHGKATENWNGGETIREYAAAAAMTSGSGPSSRQKEAEHPDIQ